MPRINNGDTGLVVRNAINELFDVVPTHIAGNWYVTEGGGLVLGAAAAANQIRLAPFIVRKAITISQLGGRLTTGSASGNCQLAIYANNAATGRPTGNALAVTGSISTTTAAAISADITGADVTLQPGIYWSAVNVDASGASAVFLGPAASAALGGRLIGNSTLSTAMAGNVAGANLLVAQTFGTWPDLTGGSFTYSASTVNAINLAVLAA
jgi:hypothetical protein